MWQLHLSVKSPEVIALAASLASEEKVTGQGDSLSFTLAEPRAKDLRAMWNTRVRSLIIAHNVLEVMSS
jgi:hypothetical protein